LLEYSLYSHYKSFAYVSEHAYCLVTKVLQQQKFHHIFT
jgi:hypothetical protein